MWSGHHPRVNAVGYSNKDFDIEWAVPKVYSVLNEIYKSGARFHKEPSENFKLKI